MEEQELVCNLAELDLSQQAVGVPIISRAAAASTTTRTAQETDESSIEQGISTPLLWGGALVGVSVLSALLWWIGYLPASRWDTAESEDKQIKQIAEPKDSSPSTDQPIDNFQPASGARGADKSVANSRNEKNQEPTPKGASKANSRASTGSGISVKGGQGKTLFGFDAERRSQLSEYLQAAGLSKAKAGITNFKIVGKLNGLAKDLALEPDEFNRIYFPELKKYPQLFESGSLFLDPEWAAQIPEDLSPLKVGYVNNQLSPEDRDLAYIVFAAYLLAEIEFGSEFSK